MFISSPSSQSQICDRAWRQDFVESGFGAWADEKFETAPEAAPHVQPGKIPSTTFDNISEQCEQSF
jgi:hypothetical protein